MSRKIYTIILEEVETIYACLICKVSVHTKNRPYSFILLYFVSHLYSFWSCPILALVLGHLGVFGVCIMLWIYPQSQFTAQFFSPLQPTDQKRQIIQLKCKGSGGSNCSSSFAASLSANKLICLDEPKHFLLIQQ